MTPSRSWRASDTLRLLAVSLALGLTLGALVSLAISRAGTLFDYSEPTLRTAVGLAAFVELAAVLVLAAFVLARRRESVGR
ncbi:MAG: hypothetical protein WKF48_02915 [Solirubrobacteraceae bacterium]